MKAAASLAMIMAILGTIVSGMIMGVTVQTGNKYSDLFQSGTVKTTSERIESGVFALNALERGKLEMNLLGSEDYRIYEDDSGKYISYDDDDDNTRELKNLPDTEYSINRDKEDPPVGEICIVKDSAGTLFIRGGECSEG